jgi:hypothetical protein
MDGPLLKVEGILSHGLTGHKSIYAVPVGAFNLLSDYRQAKQKVPNCKIECLPQRGPNDGFLQVRILTHNGCGVSASSCLVLDCGDGYEKSIPVMSSPCKKFRGALDVLFGRPT